MVLGTSPTLEMNSKEIKNMGFLKEKYWFSTLMVIAMKENGINLPPKAGGSSSILIRKFSADILCKEATSTLKLFLG